MRLRLLSKDRQSLLKLISFDFLVVCMQVSRAGRSWDDGGLQSFPVELMMASGCQKVRRHTCQPGTDPADCNSPEDQNSHPELITSLHPCNAQPHQCPP